MRVDGVGNPMARVMLVGEAPGEEKAKRGIPFVGKAGNELDYWLRRTCRLERDDVFITNVCRERPPNNRDPKPEEIERDLADLWGEIVGAGPEVIVPLGLISTRYFLGPWASMELCGGLPHHASVEYQGARWEGTVVPVHHPAAGLHQPEFYALTVRDFEALARYLRGDLALHTVDTGPVYYSWQSDAGLIDRHPQFADGVVTIDTEGSVEHPWCLTFSGHMRHATLIRATSPKSLACFQRSIDEYRPTVVMHYAPHDLRVLDAMGVHIDPSRVQVLDTMQLAYLAGRLPQGLKTLAYRLCGMRMRDYEDLVGPANERLAASFLEQIEDLFSPAHPKEKKHPVWKAVQRCLKSPRGPRALWGDQQPGIHEAVGPYEMPVATLDDVPFEDVLSYACADADATRRVFFKLRECFD
jgi:DNA polymerase